MKTVLIATGIAAALVLPATSAAHADKRRDTEAAGVTTAFTALPTENYRLSARYNQRGRMWSSGRHTGLDFSTSRGTAVRSVASGKVVKSGWAGPYGKLVIVRHFDGKSTYYAHLAGIKVKRGQKVAAGQRLGAVGSTGNSTGPHLHFEVRSKRGQHMNPQAHLRGE